MKTIILALFAIFATTLAFPQSYDEPRQIVINAEPRQATCPALPSFMANFDRIVGGQQATAPIPWQVSVRACSTSACNAISYYCGGTILDSKTILSAAHCFQNAGTDYTSHYIKAGGTNVFGDQNIKIDQVINHPNYNGQTNDNDVAILKLSQPLNLGSSAQAICLPSDNFEPADGAKCFVSGWGTLSSGGSSPRDLMWVSVPKVSDASCKNAYWYLTENMICAGEEQGGKDSCQGDSGGPFVCMENGTPKITGVVSFGKGCALAGYPGVYARVTKYLPWIKSYMENGTPAPSTPAPATPVCQVQSWYKDGFCDDVNNTAECLYDGGDCCGDNVNTTWCSVCECKQLAG